MEKYKEFKIMNIHDGTDSRFGSIVAVEANPVMDNGFSKSFVPHKYSETVTFFFPARNQYVIDELLRIANGGGLWMPDLDNEFNEENIFDEVAGHRKPIYRHISFFDFSTDMNYNINSGKRVQLIPDIQYKARTLNNQFYQGNWFEAYYSFRSYVESLAEGNDVRNFWGWLFNRPDFNGFMPYELPEEYYDEYERFLDVCEKLDNTEY